MPPIDPITVQHDVRPVDQVRVVVHTMGVSGPTTSDNHWSIYLVLPNNTGSIRINMRAEYEDPTGLLEWTSHIYAVTTSAIKYWDFPAASGVQVAHIARLIYGLGRHKYEMSGGGSGCRYWVYSIMYDLGQNNYVSGQASQQLWPHLQFQYHTSGSFKPLNWVQGTFLA
ncbi:hypothetical protein DTO280E4_8389 [Paecilomyces variotii]|nr:hypothetical protein DTO207G8_4337 [Paecilomyces variotii]KAJ9351094.1 hypothetical protein DTO280E4_8389 [Paecilomyces variotii]